MKSFRIAAVLLLALCAACLYGRKAEAAALDTVDAVITWGNGKAYFFGECEELGGLSYVRYDMKADKADNGYPQRVNSKTWPGLALDEIVAAVLGDSGQAYFFGYKKGVDDILYVRYNIAKDKADDGYPLAVSEKTWKGSDALNTIDDAINVGDGNIYFIGSVSDDDPAQYVWTFNIKSDKIVGAPTKINSKLFPGMKITYIDAMTVWNNGKAYIFGTIGDDEDLYYERFDIAKDKMDAGYPKLVDDSTWPGL